MKHNIGVEGLKYIESITSGGSMSHERVLICPTIKVVAQKVVPKEAA